MSTPALYAKTLRPSQPPQGHLVLLHGWGANAEDLIGLTPLLNLPQILVSSPDAPLPHPHSPQGRMWYDLESRDWTGLGSSRSLLIEWLQWLEQGTQVPLSRTVLAGFSQGGAMTLDVGLQLPLAGLMVLSGYLHPEMTIDRVGLPPVLVVHGRLDGVVPLEAAQQTRSFLEEIQAPCNYHELNMGHEIIPEEIGLMREFVQTTLALT